MKERLCIALFVALCPFAVDAQTVKCERTGHVLNVVNFVYGLNGNLSCIADESSSSRTTDEIKDALAFDSGENTARLAFYYDRHIYSDFIQGIEQIRLDKQAGASPSSQGTTSMVSKGVASQILSLATEAGALSRTDSKTTSTFRVNPINVARLLSGETAFQDYCPVYDYQCDGGLRRALEGLSAGVSFYTAPGNATTTAGSTGSAGSSGTSNGGVLGASSQTISGWNVRYDFHVRRSVKDKNFGKSYRDQFQKVYTDAVKNGVDLGKKGETLTKSLVVCGKDDKTGQCKNSGFDPYQAWLDKYAGQLKSAPGSEFDSILKNAVKDLVNLAQQYDSTFKNDVQAYATSLSTYLGHRDAQLADFINPITYSIEYDDDRPTNQPSQSTAKFIVSARPAGFQLTGNFSIQWYDHLLQSSVNRIRDAQGAVQFDKQFAKDAALSPVLSAGYYYQYMAGNSLLTLPSTALAPGTSIPLPGNASELLNTKGSIHLGQAKITFKTKNGISFPLALTFSNRTDLIKATDVRGNFGITFDLNSLFSKQ
jgi:hypothetical protein